MCTVGSPVCCVPNTNLSLALFIECLDTLCAMAIVDAEVALSE